jgi:uncharacterized alkaline shock family protein YloU
METYSETPGKTTIAPDVLISIARLTTISVSGVSKLSLHLKTINSIFRKPENEGVEVFVEDNRVYFDIYVILRRDVNVRNVCRSIQVQVTRAISETVGMDVGRINVHVEDIDYTEA